MPATRRIADTAPNATGSNAVTFQIWPARDDAVEDRASFGGLEELIDGIERAAPTLGRAGHADAHQVIDVSYGKGSRMTAWTTL